MQAEVLWQKLGGVKLSKWQDFISAPIAADGKEIWVMVIPGPGAPAWAKEDTAFLKLYNKWIE